MIEPQIYDANMNCLEEPEWNVRLECDIKTRERKRNINSSPDPHYMQWILGQKPNLNRLLLVNPL